MKLLAATALTSIALAGAALPANALPANADLRPLEEALYDYGFNYGWVSGVCYVYQKGQVSRKTAITQLKAMELVVSTDLVKRRIWSNIREEPKLTKCARILDFLDEEETKAKYSL